jgi:hypothetical protein
MPTCFPLSPSAQLLPYLSAQLNVSPSAQRLAYLQAALTAKKDYVYEKATMLALVELIFKRPPTERKIAFVDIAAATDVPVEKVEFLLMKAMSLELVKGSIDQVAQTVLVTYIKPRVLDSSQIEQVTRFPVLLRRAQALL